MPTSDDREQGTHEERVAQARRELVEELFLDDTELARDFLQLPVGGRVRVGAVRYALAQFAVERLTAVNADLRYGGFVEAGDDVTIQLPALLDAREGLQLPVRAAIVLKLGPFLIDLVQRGPAALVADLLARKNPGTREVEKRLRAAPPRSNPASRRRNRR